MDREELFELIVRAVQDGRYTYQDWDKAWQVTIPDVYRTVITDDDVRYLQLIHNIDVKSRSERYPDEH